MKNCLGKWSCCFGSSRWRSIFDDEDEVRAAAPPPLVEVLGMMTNDNVRQIRHLLALMVIPDSTNVKVEVRGQKVMTPDQARDFAIEILYAADEAEGEEMLGDFGYSMTDSRNLGELYTLLDQELGWEDDEQEVDGDYRERIKQVGKILRQRGLRVVKA